VTQLRKRDKAGVGVAALLLGGLLVIGGVVAGSALDDGDRPEQDNKSGCSENAGKPTNSTPLKRRTVLQPDTNSETRVTNFGDDRDPEYPVYAIKADRPLDKRAEKGLSITPETITRTGEPTAETETFPEPTFTKPTVSGGDRTRIRFRVCLAPTSKLPPGQYTGLVTLDGPRGLEGTSVTVTANAKAKWLFWVGVAASILLASLVLFYKGVADWRTANIEAASTENEKTAARRWAPAAGDTVRDLGWWAPTIFALGAMFGILYGIWANDPSWGQSGLGSALALIGAGVGAVGAKTIFTPSSR
jgi:hypothetical protein